MSVRLPRHSIWPILPGARSFLNCGAVRAREGSRRELCLPLRECPGGGRQPGRNGRCAGEERGHTAALSGMKRSPRHRTNLEVMAWAHTMLSGGAAHGRDGGQAVRRSSRRARASGLGAGGGEGGTGRAKLRAPTQNPPGGITRNCAFSCGKATPALAGSFSGAIAKMQPSMATAASPAAGPGAQHVLE